MVLRTESLIARSMRLISILAIMGFATFTTAPFSRAFAANTPRPGPNFQKVMIVVLENADLQEAMKQPGFAEFARHGALLNRFYAETHPSQPNYIALISGDTQNVHNDSDVTLNARHIGDSLDAKGLSWKAYLEDYPGNCFPGSKSDNYVRKHNPFISFSTVRTSTAKCAHLVNSGQLQNDLRSRSLPDFSIYIPNLKNDGHDTSPSYASRWLTEIFLPSLGASWPKGLLLIVTFDESESKKENRIYTALYGEDVRPGSSSDFPYSHYSILQTIEDRFRLAPLGKNDAQAKGITDVWN